MHYKQILMDIEAQRDFFSPGGACLSANSAEAAGNIRRLFGWARRQGIPVLSTVLRCRSGRKGPLAPVPHCVEGTDGEKRISGALLRRYVDLGIRNSTDLPPDIFSQYQQVIFEKRHTDIFQHARAERLLTELSADTFIVCGAGSARGIVEAVIGLRQRGFDVVLAADAIVDIGDPKAEMAWLRMLAKGAVPLSTDEIVSPPQQAGRPAAEVSLPTGQAGNRGESRLEPQQRGGDLVSKPRRRAVSRSRAFGHRRLATSGRGHKAAG